MFAKISISLPSVYTIFITDTDWCIMNFIEIFEKEIVTMLVSEIYGFLCTFNRFATSSKSRTP